MTKRAVGIAVNNGYAVTPDRSEYSGFFDLLRTEGRRTQPLDALTDAALANVNALLLGAPRWMIREPEVLSTLAWVRGGGSLLVLATMGGDAPADGSRDGYNALSRLCPGVTLRRVVLGTIREKGVDQNQYPYFELDRTISLDASPLLGAGTTLRYASGCALSYASLDASHITHELPILQPFDEVEAPREEEEDFYSWSDAPPGPASGAGLVRYRHGDGTITVFGAARSLRNDHLGEANNVEMLSWLFAHWLPNLAHEEVFARKRRPQRHRLLHGYPMQPLVPTISEASRAEVERREFAPAADDRGLIVGVLPHPFCNPQVRGCGFCTFPHEVYGNARAREVASVVADEIDAWRERADRAGYTARKVHAVYLGGATANLTPPDAMLRVADALARAFDLSGAEITLEGVPIHFQTRDHTAPLFKQHLGARRHRWSLGVQTFDRAQLERMGRTAFGGEQCIREVVALAHATDRTVSCDLLFNLPGQSLEAMSDDVDRAVAIGFDHVCLYHLVLFEGLGTEWSMDKSLLAALPDNRAACERWVALRERLLAHGFVQTSLTNFERREVHESDARFSYESAAYRPEKFDLVGFGPTAISLRYDRDLRGAVKLLNPDDAEAYVASARAQRPRIKAFQYDERDAKILFLTRRIVTLGWSTSDYRARFGSSPEQDFSLELEALTRDRLVTVHGDAVSLTPKGMFYADTVAAMFAWRRVNRLRHALPSRRAFSDTVRVYDPNNSNFDPMG